MTRNIIYNLGKFGHREAIFLDIKQRTAEANSCQSFESNSTDFQFIFSSKES